MTTPNKRTNTPEEDALERWAASDEPTIREDATIIRGSEESRAEMHALLMDSAADDDQRAMVERAAKGGRPRLYPGEGRSPVWRVRVPQPLDEKLHAAAEAEGRNFSEVLRAAADEYLKNHHRKLTSA